MEHFDDLEWDIFREIGNIGSGHASVAMSLLVDGKTHISRTETLLSSPKDLMKSEFAGSENVDILHLGINGDLAGNTLILMVGETSAHLSRLLLEKKGNRAYVDSISAIQEFGNILVGSYMTALSNLVHLSAIPKVSNFIPQGKRDEAIGALGLGSGKKTLAIKTQVMNTDYGLSVIIFVLFDEGSLGKILLRTKPKDILVIDSLEKAKMIKGLLEEYSNLSIMHAADIASAGKVVRDRPPHLCLIDEAIMKDARLSDLRKAAGKNASIAVIGKAQPGASPPGVKLSYLRKPVSKERLIQLIDASGKPKG